MRTKATEEKATEQQFELKYCERCGGLWLRPVGGGQIYCAVCGRAMAELPPASHQADRARMPRGPRWERDGGEFEGAGEAYLEWGYENDGTDVDAGGVA